MIYTPDGYKIIKIQAYESEEFILKVFGSWSGGYTKGDSWRVNSGITAIEEDEDVYIVYGNSRSRYVLSKTHNSITSYNTRVLTDMIEELCSYGHNVEIISIEDAIAITGA